jgi:hypothetical protein
MTTVKRFEPALELIIIVMAFIATNIATANFQQPITENNGRGFDGVYYFEVAQQFSDGLVPRSDAPFVYRLGTPFLASLVFRENLFISFKVVNILANFLSALLLALWLRLYLHNFWIRIILVILFITQWHGPTRFVYFYPVNSDAWLFVFLLLGLLGIHKFSNRLNSTAVTLLGSVSLVGAIFREVTLVVPIALLFSSNPLPRMGGDWRSCLDLLMPRINRRLFCSLVPLLFGLLGVFAVHVIASQTNHYSFIRTTINWAYNKPLLSYVHAYFVSYGPIIIIPIFYWRQTIDFLLDNQFMFVYLLCFMVLAWVGGSDTERLLFWGMPVVYLLIGMLIQEKMAILKYHGFVGCLLLSQFVSQRIFWNIPDYPNRYPTPIPILTVLSSRFQYFDLWSYHGSHMIQTVSLLQYIFLSAFLIVWLRKLESLTGYRNDPSSAA